MSVVRFIDISDNSLQHSQLKSCFSWTFTSVVRSLTCGPDK